MPDAGVLATILLIVGLFLVALELMIPSFGTLGISATICLVVSAWCAWQAWWGSAAGFFWTYAGFWLIGPPTVFFVTLYLIQHTPLGGIVVLRGPQADFDGASPRVRNRLQELVGQVGQAVSPLAPGGMVEVNGERIHAVSVGPVIDSGAPVRIVATRGTRLVVRQGEAYAGDAEPANPVPGTADESPSAMADRTTAAGTTGSENDQLDFEVPDDYTAG